MSIYTCFVTCQYIKNNSPVIAYVSDDELQIFIKVAQDTQIQRVLGTNLMKDLQAKVLANTLSADEIILMEEYIQTATTHATVYEFLLYNHYKITNKGITKQNSENSTSADLNEVNFLRDDVRNKAEYFRERLTKYLQANTTKFPMYFGGVVDASTIVPKRNNYYSGIYTGRGRGGKCDDCGNGPYGPNNYIDLR